MLSGTGARKCQHGGCAIDDIRLKLIILNPNLVQLFAHNLSLNHPIVWLFCTVHGNDTDVFYANNQNKWSTETDVMFER